MREDRYADAAPYLPAPYDKVLEKYVDALNRGADAKLPQQERAKALFAAAAWIARHDGMELMGTEGAPDGFISGGSFEEPDLAKERQAGTYLKTSYDSSGGHEARVPIALKPSAEERQRLTKNKIQPDVRFHYRVIAGALAIARRAAAAG